MRLVTVTPPAAEPISAADVREYLKVDDDTEEATIARLIGAAREHVERSTAHRLITQTVEGILDVWPAARGRGGDGWDLEVAPSVIPAPYVEIPVGPVQSVTKVETVGADGVTTVLDPGAWYLDRSRTRLAPAAGSAWTSPGRAVGGIVVTFVAGYGAAPDDVPFSLRQAAAMLAAHWYEHREAALEGSFSEPPHSVKAILAKHRPIRI